MNGSIKTPVFAGNSVTSRVIRSPRSKHRYWRVDTTGDVKPVDSTPIRSNPQNSTSSRPNSSKPATPSLARLGELATSASALCSPRQMRTGAGARENMPLSTTVSTSAAGVSTDASPAFAALQKKVAALAPPEGIVAASAAGNVESEDDGSSKRQLLPRNYQEAVRCRTADTVELTLPIQGAFRGPLSPRKRAEQYWQAKMDRLKPLTLRDLSSSMTSKQKAASSKGSLIWAGGTSIRPGKDDELLSLLEESQIALLEVWYVQQLARNGNQMFPSRQNLMEGEGFPPAFVVVNKRGCRSGRHEFVLDLADRQIFSVSHPWLSKEHPDPQGTQLKQLVEELDAQNAKPGDVVFYDFCSIYQPMEKERMATKEPEVDKKDKNAALRASVAKLNELKDPTRTPEHEILFQKALQGMELLFSHERCKVVILPEVPLGPLQCWGSPPDSPKNPGRGSCKILQQDKIKILQNSGKSQQKAEVDRKHRTPYIERGWCFFEASVAHFFGRVANAQRPPVQEVLGQISHTPLSVESFVKILQEEKVFSKDADWFAVQSMFGRLFASGLDGALRAAVSRGLHAKVKTLLGARADPEAQDRWGRNAQNYALAMPPGQARVGMLQLLS